MGTGERPVEDRAEVHSHATEMPRVEASHSGCELFYTIFRSQSTLNVILGVDRTVRVKFSPNAPGSYIFNL